MFVFHKSGNGVALPNRCEGAFPKCKIQAFFQACPETFAMVSLFKTVNMHAAPSWHKSFSVHCFHAVTNC